MALQHILSPYRFHPKLAATFCQRQKLKYYHKKKKKKTIQKGWKYVTKSHWLGFRSLTLSSKNKISFKQTEVNNIYRHRKDVNTPPPTNNTIVIRISCSFLFRFYVFCFFHFASDYALGGQQAMGSVCVLSGMRGEEKDSMNLNIKYVNGVLM